MRALAAEATKGAPTPLLKARAVYACVLAHMHYDKTGSGWGQGDIHWACDAGRGNCTTSTPSSLASCERAVFRPAFIGTHRRCQGASSATSR
jgi:hypothetical protein